MYVYRSSCNNLASPQQPRTKTEIWPQVYGKTESATKSQAQRNKAARKLGSEYEITTELHFVYMTNMSLVFVGVLLVRVWCMGASKRCPGVSRGVYVCRIPR